MKNFLLILSTFAAAGIMLSCGGTKKITTAIAKKDTAQVVIVDNSHADSLSYIHTVYNQVEKNRINFNSFSAKAKVDYWDKDGKGPDLTVFIRVQKDSIIWLSINATVFSYEAFRVMITKDSVKVLNKKDKTVQLRSVNYLQEVAKLPFDFSTLQDLIIGNPVFLDTNIVSYKKNENNVVLLSVGQLFKHLLTISAGDYVPQHSKLDDVDAMRNRTCDITYSSYENKTGILFSTFRKITVSEKAKLDIEIDFKQYSFNENLVFPFTIPKNYRRD